MLTRRLAVLALGALLVTGCSGGDDSGAAPSGPWSPAAEDIRELPNSGDQVAFIPADLVPDSATGGCVVFQDEG